MQTLWQDLRYAARMLTKSPGFLIVAVLTLAMAIGANAVVFSVMNALILHPLHVPNADSLYAIQHGNEASLYESYPDYLDLRDRNRSFEGLAAFNIDQAGVDTRENPSRIWLAEVSGTLAVCYTLPMSRGQTALLMLCLAIRIGTRIFRMTPA